MKILATMSESAPIISQVRFHRRGQMNRLILITTKSQGQLLTQCKQPRVIIAQVDQQIKETYSAERKQLKTISQKGQVILNLPMIWGKQFNNAKKNYSNTVRN